MTVAHQIRHTVRFAVPPRAIYGALMDSRQHRAFTGAPAKIEPKVAAGAEPSADFKSWTINLRKGSRWSDGEPFTADDILFWYNDVLLNKELTPTLPGWIKNPDGTTGPIVLQNPVPGQIGNHPLSLSAAGKWRFDANLSFENLCCSAALTAR